MPIAFDLTVGDPDVATTRDIALAWTRLGDKGMGILACELSLDGTPAENVGESA